MAFLNDLALDEGLDWVDTNGTRVDILSQEAAVYGDIATYGLGNKTGVNPDAPADRGGGGRMVNIPAITDGSVTGDGTATHWALSDGASLLVASYSLATGQGVSNGNTFTLTAFEVGIPDPA